MMIKHLHVSDQNRKCSKHLPTWIQRKL